MRYIIKALAALTLTTMGCSMGYERLIIPLPNDQAWHRVHVTDDEALGSSLAASRDWTCRVTQSVTEGEVTLEQLTNCEEVRTFTFAESGTLEKVLTQSVGAAAVGAGLGAGLAFSGDDVTTDNSNANANAATSKQRQSQRQRQTQTQRVAPPYKKKRLPR